MPTRITQHPSVPTAKKKSPSPIGLGLGSGNSPSEDMKLIVNNGRTPRQSSPTPAFVQAERR